MRSCHRFGISHFDFMNIDKFFENFHRSRCLPFQQIFSHKVLLLLLLLLMNGGTRQFNFVCKLWATNRQRILNLKVFLSYNTLHTYVAVDLQVDWTFGTTFVMLQNGSTCNYFNWWRVHCLISSTGKTSLAPQHRVNLTTKITTFASGRNLWRLRYLLLWLTLK